MAEEFYAVYPKDAWKDSSYRLMDKFSLKGKKGFVTGGGGGIAETRRQPGLRLEQMSRWWIFPPPKTD